MAPVTATRAFLVPGYSNSDGYLVGDYLPRRSAAFAVSGYDWSIHYRPSAENVDICLRIQIKEAPKVTASFSVSILDPTGSLPPWTLPDATSRVFAPRHVDNSGEVAVSMSRSFLQDLAPDPKYLTRGGLLFGCTITVFTETTTPALSRAEAPESDMMEQLGKIYTTEDGSDVTYSVKGKLFRAHKVILAMRSPVFRAQLYGGMMESTAQIIEVQDVLPDVFEALLRYIYTDDLPTMDAIKVDDEHDEEVDEDVITELISHLVVASDRYGVERLRILCECGLCDLVGPDNWVKMLVFAQEQHLDRLKDACVKFMATSDRAGKVVASEEYAQLRRTHPLILIDVLEKINEFRENMLNPCFREMKA